MNENDKKLLKEVEDFLQDVYWYYCRHAYLNKEAAKAQALSFSVAKLRGYEGD